MLLINGQFKACQNDLPFRSVFTFRFYMNIFTLFDMHNSGGEKKKKLFQPYKGTTIKSFEKHIRWMSALVLSILFLEKCPFLLLSVTNVLQKERNISENRNETRYKAKDKRVSSITWQVLKPFGNSIKPTKTERKKILVNNLLWH